MNLDTLNLTQNSLKCVEGLKPLVKLTTILLSHNRIVYAADTEGLLECPTIRCVLPFKQKFQKSKNIFFQKKISKNQKKISKNRKKIQKKSKKNKKILKISKKK